MRVVHLLRKCDPAEWGGTETAIHRLFEGLRQQQVDSVVYCPQVANGHGPDPLTEAGCEVKRFKAFVPIWGISSSQRQRLISVGGNLMSLDLLPALWREPAVSLIHTHTLGRLGGVAAAVARSRGLPLVVTIHGGLLDLPSSLRAPPACSRSVGWDWGRVFGLLLRSHQLLDYAAAILTCNPQEAALLRERHPQKRIRVQPHGVPTALYRPDCRPVAQTAFPEVRGRTILLCVGRIDPVKNQGWLVKQTAALAQRHPEVLLVLAGATTDAAYCRQLRLDIERLGLSHHVRLVGALPPNDARLIGLYQSARALLLSSISETFGLVILEAWAAGVSVIASRTSGPAALVKPGQNGWLFDLAEPAAFHVAVDCVLQNPRLANDLARAGQLLASRDYDTGVLAGRLKRQYEELIEETHALRHSARR